MHALETADLLKIYKGKKGASIEAVKGLTFAVDQGEVFGFLGPNGAGKSTTIKMLMGLIRPTSGAARIMGLDVCSHNSRKHVGYLPENPSFYDYLTAEEYLQFVGRTFGLNKHVVSGKIHEVLTLLDLSNAKNRPIRGFSKGMVQRLGIAQTMIHDPDVYVLDEPMSGLDPIGRALVKDIILDLRSKGKCIFFSTHITADVESVCDRVGVIVKGQLQRVEWVNSILTEGIVGYHIRTKMPGSGEQKDFSIARADLFRWMEKASGSGHEIVSIEPERKNIEAFFLDIVKGKHC